MPYHNQFIKKANRKKTFIKPAIIKPTIKKPVIIKPPIRTARIIKPRIRKSTIGKTVNYNRNSFTTSMDNQDISLIKLYLILLFITAIIIAITQNRIELHIVVNEIKAEGIDYDAFRDMKIPVNMMQKVKKEMDDTKELKPNNTNDVKNSEAKDAASYLSLYFLVNQLDASNKLSKGNYRNLIKYLYDNKSFMELKGYYYAILKDIECFPVASDAKCGSVVSFTDTWYYYRSYGGNRRHEGTDLMAMDNTRGIHEVISMTDGVVEKMGWLEQGGYRIGVRGTSGAYFYYAHLDSYAPGVKIGDTIKAGQFLGYMGDSGYGKEGTTGKFDVHLHMGIYINTSFGELSVNPYSILQYLEAKQ